MDREARVKKLAIEMAKANGIENIVDVNMDLYCSWADLAITAIEAAGGYAPPGYWIAPDEPTEEMIDAGADAINKQMRGPGAPADWHASKDAYRAFALRTHKG